MRQPLRTSNNRARSAISSAHKKKNRRGFEPERFSVSRAVKCEGLRVANITIGILQIRWAGDGDKDVGALDNTVYRLSA